MCIVVGAVGLIISVVTKLFTPKGKPHGVISPKNS